MDLVSDSEKKLRRRLQQAEEALIEAQHDLEDAQARLGRAEARLRKRKAAALTARADLAAYVSAQRPAVEAPPATPSVPEVTPPALQATGLVTASEVVAAGEGPASTRPRRRRATAPLAAEPTDGGNGADDGPLGLIVP